MTATPYNKTYLDLSAQLRLFVDDDKDLGVRPERMLRDMGEAEFAGRYQVLPSTLAAFEKSTSADDWRELMRLFLVRRTRTFIQAHYAKTGADGRKYLVLEDGSPSYFPTRVPKTLKFTMDSRDAADQYARLYSETVVDTINGLTLPRYGLANYLRGNAANAGGSGRRARYRKPIAGRQAPPRLLPHWLVQAAGEQRQRLHPIAGPPRAAQLRLHLCH